MHFHQGLMIGLHDNAMVIYHECTIVSHNKDAVVHIFSRINGHIIKNP